MESSGNVLKREAYWSFFMNFIVQSLATLYNEIIDNSDNMLLTSKIYRNILQGCKNKLWKIRI